MLRISESSCRPTTIAAGCERLIQPTERSSVTHSWGTVRTVSPTQCDVRRPVSAIGNWIRGRFRRLSRRKLRKTRKTKQSDDDNNDSAANPRSNSGARFDGFDDDDNDRETYATCFGTSHHVERAEFSTGRHENDNARILPRSAAVVRGGPVTSARESRFQMLNGQLPRLRIPQYRVREQNWALDHESSCSSAHSNLILCDDYIGYLIATGPPSPTDEFDLTYIGDVSADAFFKLTEAASFSASPTSAKTRLTSQEASGHCSCELLQPSRRQLRDSMTKTDESVNKAVPEDWWRWHTCLDFEQLRARLTECLSKE